MQEWTRIICHFSVQDLPVQLLFMFTHKQGVAEGEEGNPKGTNTGNDVMKLHGQLNISMSSGQQNWTRPGHCCFIHSVLKSSQFWPSPWPPLPSPAFSISLHCLHFLRGHLNIFVFSNVSWLFLDLVIFDDIEQIKLFALSQYWVISVDTAWHFPSMSTCQLLICDRRCSYIKNPICPADNLFVLYLLQLSLLLCLCGPLFSLIPVAKKWL